MAKIGVVSEYAEVIVAITKLMTPVHCFVPITYPFNLAGLKADPPDAFIVAIFRKTGAIGRPIENFITDLVGGEALQVMTGIPEVLARPIILFGIGVLPSEIPKHVPYYSFLTFPAAIQELNPLLTALMGTGSHAANPDRQVALAENLGNIEHPGHPEQHAEQEAVPSAEVPNTLSGESLKAG